MSIVIRINGNTAGDGFLVAPDNGRVFPVSLKLEPETVLLKPAKKERSQWH
jgi:hypothetical protein